RPHIDLRSGEPGHQRQRCVVEMSDADDGTMEVEAGRRMSESYPAAAAGVPWAGMRPAPANLPWSNVLRALLLWAAASGSAGCVLAPRYVLLKEFAPNLEEGTAPGLAGKRVLVRVSDQRVDINTKWRGSVALDESTGLPLRQMERWETEQWDAERDALERS